MSKEKKAEWEYLSQGQREEIRVYLRSWVFPVGSAAIVIAGLLGTVFGQWLEQRAQSRAFEAIAETRTELAEIEGSISGLLRLYQGEENGPNLSELSGFVAEVERLRTEYNSADEFVKRAENAIDLVEEFQSDLLVNGWPAAISCTSASGEAASIFFIVHPFHRDSLDSSSVNVVYRLSSNENYSIRFDEDNRIITRFNTNVEDDSFEGGLTYSDCRIRDSIDSIVGDGRAYGVFHLAERDL